MSTKTTTPEGRPKLTKAMVKAITQTAAEAAVNLYQEKLDTVRTDLKDKRLHNTKLLIQKYRWLKEYNENAVYETAQLCSEESDSVLKMLGVDAGDRYQVGSIRNSIVVTRMIMEHIETMLDCYRRKCMESKKPEVNRRWRVLWNLYLSDDPKTADEISEIEHISRSTVYADIDIVCSELSPLFFGLDLTEFYD